MSEELPLPDYDDLPLGTLQHRVRALDEPQLRRLMSYEQEHANRTPVLEVMRARLEQLADGATPSPGSQERTPEVTEQRHGSAAGDSTAAEPGTPLRHGVAEQTPGRARP
ncbi:hypothetical protein ACFS2C_15585 [Prauserella oleivorans]|uniref:DUF8129 domain-containing protein n=1 Tax=Prauserella oleivorans TaxID=1478153 RepID=A0ABW5W9Z0_9PSEU